VDDEFKRRMGLRIRQMQRARRRKNFGRSSLESTTKWVMRDRYIAKFDIPFDTMTEMVASCALDLGCELDIDTDRRYTRDIDSRPMVTWVVFPDEDLNLDRV